MSEPSFNFPGFSALAISPAVSWDGAQIAYVTDDPSFSIRVASPRGGPPLKLVDFGFVSLPTWAPMASCTSSGKTAPCSA